MNKRFITLLLAAGIAVIFATTGLHADDVQALVMVLHELVDRGHTVLVIEHNLDVIKTADWVIDIGPEGGDGGGEIIACGTPEQVADTDQSHTGLFLKQILYEHDNGEEVRLAS